MIRVENLTKGFGNQVLFAGINFKLNPKERLGVVGRNGHGKTTFFRLIVGEEKPDSGHIIIPKNYRIGYVRQKIEFTKDTVLAEGMKGLSKEEGDHYWKVEKVLAGLGFSPTDIQRHPGEISGGYQVRLNLAKILVSEPDLLLLDEPTNYLDITSIRWIERFLLNWPHEVMIITHDRSFLDGVVTHVMGIHHKKIRKIAGNTEKYYTQIAQEEEIHEKTRIKDERRVKEIEQFISRFRAKARLANLVQSRIKTLKKMEKKQRLETIKTLDFSFRNHSFHGKYMLNAQNIFFSYDPNRALIRDFNIALAANDRVCVIGKNGQGKTTLLKLIAGVLTPQQGEFTCNPNMQIGYFEQTHVNHLIDTRTVEEEILYSHPDVDRQQARNICGAMLFQGDHALKKIQVLSGGEKSRVMLGKLLVTPLNLLVLDEPTNHLDLDSSDALLAAIDNFNGTVLMVTHNEMYLHALANRLIIFQNGTVEVFEGSYQRFLEEVGWKEESIKAKRHRDSLINKKSALKKTKKELRRRRSEIIATRSNKLKTIRQQILRIENEIDTQEKRLLELDEAMITATRDRQGTRIEDIAKSMHTCRSSIEKLFDELEILTNNLEVQRSAFDEKLKRLESEI